MNTRTFPRMALRKLALAILSILAFPADAGATGETTRVSLASDGTQGNSGSDNGVRPVISFDNRYVVFVSAANNLVPGDSNNADDVFVRDRRTGVTRLVSRASDGTLGNGNSRRPAISTDGAFVAFDSDASNLVPGDTNGTCDVFLHNLQARTTSRVSVALNGAQSNGCSRSPAISAKGQHVAFQSDASNLVPEDTNQQTDVFLYDRNARSTVRVSVATGGAQTTEACIPNYYYGGYSCYPGFSGEPTISANGRFIAFQSLAPNLVPGDSNHIYDIFLRDTLRGTTDRLSVASDGSQTGYFDNCYYCFFPGGFSVSPSISANGRLVAFQSININLVPGDHNFSNDIFVHDRATHQTTRVSISSGGAEAADYCYQSYTDGITCYSGSANPSMSADGRYVAFQAGAPNLVAGDTNHIPDIFVHDRWTHKTVRVKVATDGTEADGKCQKNPNYDYYNPFGLPYLCQASNRTPALSPDGRFVVFNSNADNLVSGDDNAASDVFVRDGLLQAQQTANLAVSQTDSSDPASIGTDLTYTMTVTNLGPDSAGNVLLTDISPLNAQYISTTANQGGCFQGSVSICRLGTLAPGASATISLTVRPTEASRLSNKVSVNASPIDPNNNNNVSVQYTQVQ